MEQKFRICLFGSEGCGKSSMAIRLSCGQFPHQRHNPEIEETHHIHRNFGGSPSTLILTDPADSNENMYSYYERLVARHQGYAIVYSVIDRDSFAHAEKILTLIHDLYKKVAAGGGPNERPICVLVGNKMDVDHSQQQEEEEQPQRQVETHEGRSMSEFFNCAGFFEVSALTGGLQEGFPVTRNILVESLLPPIYCLIDTIKAESTDEICDFFSSMSLQTTNPPEDGCIVC